MAGFIIAIIAGIICGSITKSMNEAKGYEGGFAWGFWLSIIGIIVVAVRPYHQTQKNIQTIREYTESYEDEYQYEQTMTHKEKNIPYIDPNNKSYANELQINENDKKFVLFHGFEQQGYSFSIYKGYEILVNDTSVSGIPLKKSVPDYDNLVSIKIVVHLNGYPDAVIPIVSNTYIGTTKYNSAISQLEQYIRGLSIIENTNKEKKESDKEKVFAETEVIQTTSAASQIREFKKLMDDGIITEEEFQRKKRQLLGF